MGKLSFHACSKYFAVIPNFSADVRYIGHTRCITTLVSAILISKHCRFQAVLYGITNHLLLDLFRQKTQRGWEISPNPKQSFRSYPGLLYLHTLPSHVGAEICNLGHACNRNLQTQRKSTVCGCQISSTCG